MKLYVILHAVISSLTYGNPPRTMLQTVIGYCSYSFQRPDGRVGLGAVLVVNAIFSVTPSVLSSKKVT